MSMSPGAALVFTAGDWAEPLAHAASAIVPLATIHSRRPISRVSMGPPSKVTESMTTATGDWLEPRVIPSAAPKARSRGIYHAKPVADYRYLTVDPSTR